MPRARASWPGPRRIAHRGGGTLAPENTIAAIRAGIAHGYRAVEFDVMLTADEVPVLMHDVDFGRTIEGPGSVALTRYADLATRDAGGWFSAAHRGEPVPRFDAVMAFCIAHGVWMNVEIKPTPGRETITGRIVGEVGGDLFANRPEVPALFSSFSVESLEAARAVAPQVPRGVLFGRLPSDAVTIARSLGCASVHVDHRGLDRDAVGMLHDAGFAVMAYTVDEPSRVALLDGWGVDAICTDRIDVIGP